MNVCDGCGFSAQKWFGRCPECGGWNTSSRPEVTTRAGVVSLGGSTPRDRIKSGIGELDRVLGGGFVVGQSSLLAGEPGIGKSTLVLQLLDALIERGNSCLLVSGEESIEQIAMRAARLGIPADRIRACATTSLPALLETVVAEAPEVVVVDSIQTIHDPSLDSVAGSPTQVSACANALTNVAKSEGRAVVLVGHVTKEGSIAGPKTLEHLVDAVFSLDGERTGSLRLLRAMKNRFGSCEETGVFAMEASGLAEVADPSAFLLGGRRPGAGSIVYPALQGSRPVLVELQALVAETRAVPRRVSIGTDARRLDLLLGVLAQRAAIVTQSMDVFAAAAGGVATKEPGADLPLCLAIASALLDVPIPGELVALGEVGLRGEIRGVPGTRRRLAEAARLGFTDALVPSGGRGDVAGIRVRAMDTVADAVVFLREMSTNVRAAETPARIA